MGNYLQLPKEYSADFSNPRVGPIGPVRINRKHPLAKYLSICLYQGRNLVSGELATYVGYIFSQNAHKAPDSDDAAFVQLDRTFVGNNAYTEFIVYRANGDPAAFSLGRFFETQNGVATTFIPITDSSTFQYRDRTQLSTVFTSTVDIYDKRPHSFAFKTDGPRSGTKITSGYIDGKQRFSEEKSFGETPTTSEVTFRLGRTSTFGSVNGFVPVFYTFEIELSDLWIRELDENPYQLLEPETPPQYFVPAATGGTAALTGTSVPTAPEADYVAGGKTIIITLTADTLVT